MSFHCRSYSRTASERAMTTTISTIATSTKVTTMNTAPSTRRPRKPFHQARSTSARNWQMESSPWWRVERWLSTMRHIRSLSRCSNVRL